MFADAREVPDGSVLQADLCIIGAGAAGITLAREFANTSTRVAVLESGGLELTSQSMDLNHGESVGLPYFPLNAARLRGFGGTTNHWGGVCRPFRADDFEYQDWIPHSDWPIRKRDLDPYYERGAEICEVASWAVYSAEQYGRTEAPLFGAPFKSRVTQRVTHSQGNFRRRYEDEVRRVPNVTVYMNASVADILTNSYGTSVSSVSVATFGPNRFSVRARVIVLAAGGIENPRILLAARGQCAQGLGNQNDLVGRFFLEHPRFVAAEIVPADPFLPIGHYDWHHNRKASVKNHLGLSGEMQRTEELSDVVLRFQPELVGAFSTVKSSTPVASLRALVRPLKKGRVPDNLGRHVKAVLRDMSAWKHASLPGAPLPIPRPELVRQIGRASPEEANALIPALAGNIGAMAYRRFGGNPRLNRLLVTAIMDPVPNRDSRVTLSDERDALGMPRPRLDWRLTDADRHSVYRTLEILATTLGRQGLGRLRIAFERHGTTWPDDLVGGYHTMGTTRMSDDPRTGVVDRHCRIHGLSNLYVAGSSVFATAGSGTPTLTLVALTLRLAAKLKKELQ